MERDCMISHGASRFLKERLFDVSDPFQVSVCKNCGVIAASQKECQNCKGDKIVSCNLPFASKLCTNEINALCIKMVLKPDDN